MSPQLIYLTLTLLKLKDSITDSEVRVRYDVLKQVLYAKPLAAVIISDGAFVLALLLSGELATMLCALGHNDLLLLANIAGRTASIILAAFVAQLFYAARIWQVGRSFNSPLRYSVIPILGLAITQLGGGMSKANNPSGSALIWNEIANAISPVQVVIM
ncbi:hypothetical protein FA13DRAFT_1798529 [Coprinellus micaceus]|uniref:Uncharacterized protein n=1 Tax=Coprinellus micaceus TaxID=71717 RepID=A0A4Y7SLS1_COPMI|nr:hypothetical protein FA13DRAFT_1798529 [Coprinellus micaceus]